MRIVYLAAGAAGAFCGACSRDVTLARALMARGHDVMLVPLYTPLAVDGPDPSVRRIFYGGIRAFLAQKWSIFRRRLPLVGRLLDSRWLLRAASRFAIDTRAEDLGEMTVSVLRGVEGRQARELDELVEFLARGNRPDVVNLTNSLLSAIAPEIKRRLGCAVVCTMQGEEAFLDRLPDAHSSDALTLMREHAESIDVFLSPSSAYADEMAELLQFSRERFLVVRPGIDVEMYRPAEPLAKGDRLRIGCLSRISADKGQDLLCRAMTEIHRRSGGKATLALAGQVAPGETAWWTGVRRELRTSGVPDECVEERGAVDLGGKLDFLHGLDLFVLPTRIAERRGMAVLEAMACGVPTVVPARGIFPEVIDLTSGGMMVEAGDEVAPIVEAVLAMMDDDAGRRVMGLAARQGVETHFSGEAMATETLQVYEHLVGGAC